LIGLVAALVPGIDVNGGFPWLLWIAIIFSVVNVVLGPILRLISLPFVLLTLGLFLLVVNAALLAVTAGLSSHLDINNFGSAVLGGLLILFGIYLLATGLRSGEAIAGAWSLRALVILPLSLVLFGWLIDRAGFIPAMLVLVFGSATASTEFRLLEVLLFSIFMTALCAVVFVWALGLPYPLIVGF